MINYELINGGAFILKKSNFIKILLLSSTIFSTAAFAQSGCNYDPLPTSAVGGHLYSSLNYNYVTDIAKYSLKPIDLRLEGRYYLSDNGLAPFAKVAAGGLLGPSGRDRKGSVIDPTTNAGRAYAYGAFGAGVRLETVKGYDKAVGMIFSAEEKFLATKYNDAARIKIQPATQADFKLYYNKSHFFINAGVTAEFGVAARKIQAPDEVPYRNKVRAITSIGIGWQFF